MAHIEEAGAKGSQQPSDWRMHTQSGVLGTLHMTGLTQHDHDKLHVFSSVECSLAPLMHKLYIFMHLVTTMLLEKKHDIYGDY